MVSRRLLRLGFTLAALSACSHAPPHKPGDEWLKAIKFEGNQKIGDATLVDGLALHRSQKRGRPPDPYLISVDADRIRGEYLRRGYLDVDVRSRVVRNGTETTVIYTVEEGVRAQTRVVITGLPSDPDLPVSKVRDTLPLADGAPFNYEQFDLAKDMLRGVVEDAGYAHVKLDASVVADRANHTAIVTLNYTPGPKCKFGTVEVVGVDGTLREAVQDRLQFQPGQQYSLNAIMSTQRALYALNRFSTVRVQPDKAGTSEVVNVKVDVSQGARHEIKLGGGFGIDPSAYEVRARVGYTIGGWPIPMETFNIDLRPAYALLRDGGYEPRIRAIATLEHQDLLWTYSKGIVEGGYNYIAYEAYTSYGPRARLAFSTPVVTDKLQLQVGWEIERLDFRNISPLIDPGLAMQLGIDKTELRGAYTQALALEARDNPIEPTFGAYAEVRVAEGSRYAAGNYDYFQVIPDLRGYVPLFAGTVLAARARVGGIFGDIPPTERFFAGGSASQRGFSERKLAPYVMGDVMGTNRVVPYGGGGLIETNLEARVPLTTIKQMPLGGVLFLDGADVRETFGDLQPTNLHWALGVGLRLKTIVGPARFDVGYRLNRKGGMEPDPSSSMAFHLSLGEAF